jgi:DNA-binding CsgD family transcriptional regulator
MIGRMSPRTIRPRLRPIHSTWLRYSVSVGAVGVAWLVRALVLTQPIDRSPFLAFGLAVLVAALAGGFGPGLLAMALSSAVAVFFYLPPELALAVHDPFDGVQLGFFVAEGVVAATAGGIVRRAARAESPSQGADRLDHLLDRAESIRGRREHRGPVTELPTERELEIARLLALGYTNDEMAASLFLSTNTVKTHLKHLYAKLGSRTRTEAVARCLELGLLSGRPGDERTSPRPE